MTEEVIEEIEQVLDKIKKCFQCGTCTGGCPVFWVHPEFNPRMIIEAVISGKTGQLFIDDLIWYCAMCYTCSVRCPQGVDPAHLMVELKNISKKMKHVPSGILAEIDAIKEAGITAAVSQSILKKREKLGLPELPPTDTNEIRILMRKLGISEELAGLKENKPREEEVVS